MSGLNVRATGVLRRGWSAAVDDYAIAGGWTHRGEALVVADAAGGVYAFDGKSGKSAWARHGAHDGGVLAMAIHPSGTTFATAGQDGRVLLWDVDEGRAKQAIDLGLGWVDNVAWVAGRHNGSPPLALARFAHMVRTVEKPGALMTIRAPSSAIAWSGAGGTGDGLLQSSGVLRRLHREASPEAGVEGIPGVDGTEPRRGHRGLRQSRQLGPLLASLHRAGFHDVGLSRQTVGTGLRRRGARCWPPAEATE